MAVAIFFLLVQHPEKIGIMIDDVVVSEMLEEKMAILQQSAETFSFSQASAVRNADDDALLGDSYHDVDKKPHFKSELAPSKHS